MTLPGCRLKICNPKPWSSPFVLGCCALIEAEDCVLGGPRIICFSSGFQHMGGHWYSQQTTRGVLVFIPLCCYARDVTVLKAFCFSCFSVLSRDGKCVSRICIIFIVGGNARHHFDIFLAGRSIILCSSTRGPSAFSTARRPERDVAFSLAVYSGRS